MEFVSLANELHEVKTLFAHKFEEKDDFLNPISLQERLRILQDKLELLKPKLVQLEVARTELMEALSGARSLGKIGNSLPEVSRLVSEAERNLGVAKAAAFSSSTSVSKRSSRIEQEVRLATALNATAGEVIKIVDKHAYESLPIEITDSITFQEVERTASNLVRCGGRLLLNNLSIQAIQALCALGIAHQSSNELCLTRTMESVLL